MVYGGIVIWDNQGLFVNVAACISVYGYKKNASFPEWTSQRSQTQTDATKACYSCLLKITFQRVRNNQSNRYII